jgi:hypothetical protein
MIFCNQANPLIFVAGMFTAGAHKKVKDIARAHQKNTKKTHKKVWPARKRFLSLEHYFFKTYIQMKRKLFLLSSSMLVISALATFYSCNADIYSVSSVYTY